MTKTPPFRLIEFTAKVRDCGNSEMCRILSAGLHNIRQMKGQAAFADRLERALARDISAVLRRYLREGLNPTGTKVRV
jgi:hypothetical protein